MSSSASLVLNKLDKLCTNHAEHLAAGDYLAASRVDFEFHRTLISSTRNELFLVMLESVEDLLREVRSRTYPQSSVGETGLEEHRTILRRVTERDADAARDAMTRHLAQAESFWLTGEPTEVGTP